VTVLLLDRYPVDPAHVETFAQLVASVLEAVRLAPGALWADAAQAADDVPSWLVLAEWRTQGDADAFLDTPEAVAFTADADVLLRGDVTRRRFAT